MTKCMDETEEVFTKEKIEEIRSTNTAGEEVKITRGHAEEMSNMILSEIRNRKETLLESWIAETGLLPTQSVLCHGMEDMTYKIWVEKKDKYSQGEKEMNYVDYGENKYVDYGEGKEDMLKNSQQELVTYERQEARAKGQAIEYLEEEIAHFQDLLGKLQGISERYGLIDDDLLYWFLKEMNIEVLIEVAGDS